MAVLNFTSREFRSQRAHVFDLADKGEKITWSRHITAHDRIIYDIYEDIVEVYVLELEGHYSDK